MQSSLHEQQLNEEKLRKEIDFLLQQLQVRDVQLVTALERLRLFEESERILTESRQQFFDDLQALRDQILAERQEKQDLRDEVAALRTGMAQLVEGSDKVGLDGRLMVEELTLLLIVLELPFGQPTGQCQCFVVYFGAIGGRCDDFASI